MMTEAERFLYGQAQRARRAWFKGEMTTDEWCRGVRFRFDLMKALVMPTLNAAATGAIGPTEFE